MAAIILPALPALKSDSKRQPKPRMIFNNHVYTIKRENKDTVSWRCTQRPCPGSAKTALDYTSPVEVQPHTMHPPDVSINVW